MNDVLISNRPHGVQVCERALESFNRKLFTAILDGLEADSLNCQPAVIRTIRNNDGMHPCLAKQSKPLLNLTRGAWERITSQDRIFAGSKMCELEPVVHGLVESLVLTIQKVAAHDATTAELSTQLPLQRIHEIEYLDPDAIISRIRPTDVVIYQGQNPKWWRSMAEVCTPDRVGNRELLRRIFETTTQFATVPASS